MKTDLNFKFCDLKLAVESSGLRDLLGALDERDFAGQRLKTYIYIYIYRERERE